MAIRTITHLYDTYDDAAQVVADLESAGIPHSDISLVANQPGNGVTAADHISGAGTGAGIGAVLGGGAGLLAGIGALAIPGIGPVVAAGWLVAALAGAGVGGAAGGLLGSLTGAGVDEDDAHVYAEGVRRGGSLVTTRADDAQSTLVESVMTRARYVDVAQRGNEYRAAGWNGFDANTPPLMTSDVDAERRLRTGT